MKLRQQLQAWMTRRSCHFCGRKKGELQSFLDADRNPISVCFICVPYAERRGYPRR
ncbi:hypothetical protein ALCH109712_11450 [Alkalicoccus chagannorensis]